MPEDLTQPPWITTKPGDHPEFTREVTPEEIERARRARSELRQLLDGPGAALITDDSRFLRDAMRDEEVARANYDLFIAAGLPDSAVPHRAVLYEALIRQGRLDEAREFADDSQLSHIETLKAALCRSSEQKHDCGREAVRLNGKERHLNRRFEREQIFNPILGKVVTVKECVHCGEPSAFEGLPERQQAIALARQHVQAQAEAKPGHLGRNLKMDDTLADHVLIPD
jgi:hypothetical protein